MNTERNRNVVTKLYERAWGRGEVAVVDEVFAEKHVLHWNELVRTKQHRTTAEVKQIIRSYRAAFPDLSVTVDNMVAEGDLVAAQVTFVGTHTGEYEGFAPTHRRSSFTDMQILRLQDGRIVESSLGSGGLKQFFAILSGAAFEEGWA